MNNSSSKRKREEDLDEINCYEDNGGFIDDESEPHRFGTSALPVANLPNFFEGIPQDGMEYLFTVRREERLLPLVTRVPNPYAVPEKNQRPGLHGNGASNSSMNVIPSEEWRICFEDRFRNLRANLRQPTIHISLPSTSVACGIPEMRDRDRWWAFFRGDVEWENVPSSQFHGNKRGKKDKQKQGIVGYEEALPQEEKMRGWVVYKEKLSWEQADQGEVIELSYGGNLNTDPVEFEDGGEDRTFLDEEFPSRESSDKEKVEEVEEVAPPLRRDSPSDVCGDPSVPGDAIGPREPTPYLLSLIDQKTTFHLLKYFSQWIQGHFDRSLLPPPPLPPSSHPDSHSQGTPPYDLTSCHGRWIFSLLSRLDPQLTSDEISVLRKLARECVKLIKDERSESSQRACSKKSTTTPRAGETACWMIIAAVTGVWGQKDLWVEAADMLR